MKKKTTKLLTLTCCALMLVAISVGATLAYLTDDDAVTNTFTVGQVHIKLDEAPVGDDGKKDSGDRVQANEYHLIPGQTYDKDPMVTLEAKSESSYIRMLVTVHDYSDLLAVCKKHTGEVDAYGNPYYMNDVVLLQNFTDWTEASPWKFETVNRNKENDTATYEFRYATAVGNDTNAPKQLEPLFNTITLPGWMDNDDLKVLGAGYKAVAAATGNNFTVTAATGDEALKINVVAHAMQAAGFEGKEDDAWVAFNTQMSN